jgi:sugar-specific transcriptional regulator TrmB
MVDVVEKLKRVGLTEYEAKAYLALLNAHLSTATQVSEKSGVPRTKIYAILESLETKGWITILSGVPLLFKAVTPAKVFEQIKEDYTEFLNSAQATLAQKVSTMKEKFVIKNLM